MTAPTPTEALALAREALTATKAMIDAALPEFNWAAFCLGGETIQMLNETPGKVSRALYALDAIPPGKWVAREPTEGMLARFRGLNRVRDTAARAVLDWQTMFDAAPGSAPKADQGWRPIDGLAMTGEPVWLYSPVHGQVAGRWECVDGGGHPDNGPEVYWWVSQSVDFSDGPDDEPTHYMPLPAPPTARAEEADHD